jgi:dTDP-4-amino-4,6-dideoxygalactose transaminase
VKFVENKRPDMALVAALLSECEAENHWANFGPLYHRLADEYSQHMQVGDDAALVPCANAGIGLELMARCLAAQAGVSELRWVGPSLSFKNLGRGYFTQMTLLDCDVSGLLDLDELTGLPLDSYDGIILINPFGMCMDFSPLIRFAQATGKHLLIDNAAGIDRKVPDWPWQVFSLHQTKPYGVGEGGLVLVPRAFEERLCNLMNYAQVPENPAHWLNNGKISDIACAFHLARLRGIAMWENAYRDQRARIAQLFAQAGVCPLYDPEPAPLTTSMPMFMPRPLDDALLAAPRLIPVSRQYIPLVSHTQADALYARLINFPTHPDMAQLTDHQILSEIENLLACCTSVSEVTV